MTTINLYKIAYGSFSNTIGDGTLYYSGGYSHRATSINGIFLDNPPVLSKDYATVIWRYYQDADRFLLMHIQGSQVVDDANARRYPYRAAFEIERTALNFISQQSLPLASLISAVPRIDTFTSRTRLEQASDVNIVVRNTFSPEAKSLAQLIVTAMLEKKRVYIAMQSTANLRENGILECPEHRLIVEAIESLPVSIARYVSYAICADNAHAKVTDDVLVMMHQPDADITVPADAIRLSWADAVAYTSTANMDVVSQLSAALPGAEAPLMPLAEASESLHDAYVRYDAIMAKTADQVVGKEWDTWLLQHSLKEVVINSWQSFDSYVSRTEGKLQQQLITAGRNTALTWKPDMAIMERMMSKLKYTDDELAPLRHSLAGQYLLSNCTENAFLFPDDKLDVILTPADVKPLLTGKDATAERIEALLTIASNMSAVAPKAAQDVLFVTIVNHLSSTFVIDSLESWQFYSKTVWSNESGNPVLLPKLRKVLAYIFDMYVENKNIDKMPKVIDKVCEAFKGRRDPRYSLMAALLVAALRKHSNKDTDIKDMEEKLNNVFKSLSKNTNSNGKRKWYLGIGSLITGLVVGALAGFGVSNAWHETQENGKAQEGGEGETQVTTPVISAALNDSTNIMLQMAEYSSLGNASIRYAEQEYFVPSELERLDSAYLASSSVKYADIKLSVINMADNKPDTLTVSASKPLFAQVKGKKLQVNNVRLPKDKETILIDIPTADYPGTEKTTADVNYYYWLIKRIQQSIDKNAPTLKVAY